MYDCSDTVHGLTAAKKGESLFHHYTRTTEEVQHMEAAAE